MRTGKLSGLLRDAGYVVHLVVKQIALGGWMHLAHLSTLPRGCWEIMMV